MSNQREVLDVTDVVDKLVVVTDVSAKTNKKYSFIAVQVGDEELVLSFDSTQVALLKVLAKVTE